MDRARRAHRVAADPDTLVVNSSQGGGSKDTWILNELRLRPRDRQAQRTLAFSLRTTPFAAPRARVDYFEARRLQRGSAIGWQQQQS